MEDSIKSRVQPEVEQNATNLDQNEQKTDQTTEKDSEINSTKPEFPLENKTGDSYNYEVQNPEKNPIAEVFQRPELVVLIIILSGIITSIIGGYRREK